MQHIRHSAIGIRQFGFTLIEVLIALVILAIGAVTLLELQLFSMRASDRAVRQSQALLLAQQKMAEAVAANSLDAGGSQGTTDNDTPGGPLNWGVMVSELTSAETLDVSTLGLRSVTVTVSWTEGPAERKVELVNYVAQRTSNVQTSQIAAAPTGKTRKREKE